MSAEVIFPYCNYLAMVGWILLIFLPRNKWTARIVMGGVIPGLLSIVYLAIILVHWWGADGGFGSITQVQSLFENKWILLGGWVHYLAFDLFVGSWEVRDSQTHNISHFFIIPCLVLTFLFGPIGYLLYQLIKFIASRSSQK